MHAIRRMAENKQQRNNGRSQWDHNLPELARIGAVLLFVLGLVLCYRFLSIFDMEGFGAVVDMCNAELGFKFAMELCISAVIIAALVGVTGCIGYVGIDSKRPKTMSVYLCLTLILFVLATVTGFFTLYVDDHVGFLIEREVEGLCGDAIQHARMAAVLGCPVIAGELNATKLAQECDSICQAEADHLQSIGGCHLMDVLCHKFTYALVGRGRCLVKGADEVSHVLSSGLIVSSSEQRVPEECCRLACDQALHCVGFGHSQKSGICELGSPYVTFGHLVQDGSNSSGPSTQTESLQAPAHTVSLLSTSAADPHHDPGLEGEEDDDQTDPVLATERRARKREMKQRRIREQCMDVSWILPDQAMRLQAETLETLAVEDIVASSEIDTDFTCERKTKRTVVWQSIMSAGSWLLIGSFVSAAILLLTFVCGCTYSWRLIPRRVRKYQSNSATIRQIFLPSRQKSQAQPGRAEKQCQSSTAATESTSDSQSQSQSRSLGGVL